MAKLRISIVQYLNTAPLVWGFTNGPLRGKYELSFTVPSQCAEALRSGAADVAIIPAIEYQRIEDLVVLPGVAIASKRRVRSLVIVARKPMEQVRRFALDRGSRSTQALTRILCAEKWKIAPEFFEGDPEVEGLEGMLGKADAALIIGDPALRVSLAADEYAPVPIKKKSFWKRAEASPASEEPLDVLDVVGEWRKLTDLPAVLAIWAGRREVITPEVMADFVSSREYGLMRIAEISKSAAGQLGLPAADLEAYLRENIDFGLDAENQKGLTDFYRRAALMGLTPTAKPIEWAAVIDGHLAASQHVGD